MENQNKKIPRPWGDNSLASDKTAEMNMLKNIEEMQAAGGDQLNAKFMETLRKLSERTFDDFKDMFTTIKGDPKDLIITRLDEMSSEWFTVGYNIETGKTSFANYEYKDSFGVVHVGYLCENSKYALSDWQLRERFKEKGLIFDNRHKRTE